MQRQQQTSTMIRSRTRNWRGGASEVEGDKRSNENSNKMCEAGIDVF